MKDKKQNRHLSLQDGMEINRLTTVIYDGKPLPEWLRCPISEQEWASSEQHWSVVVRQWNEGSAPIPDWVLEPVNF